MAVTQTIENDPQDGSRFIVRLIDGSQVFIRSYPNGLTPGCVINGSYPCMDIRGGLPGTPVTYVAPTAADYALMGIYDKLNPYVVTINGGQPITWTNMPSALTGAQGTQTKVPLYTAYVARLTADVLVAGSTNAVLIAQVSLNGSSWTSGPQVSISTTGLKVSGLVVIPAQFQTDCFFRIAGQGGDGVADPQFGLTTVQFG
jgi:hypothetical protein